MKMDKLSIQAELDRKRLSGGRMKASRKSPQRASNTPRANSVAHSKQKKMPPTNTATDANGQGEPLGLIWGASEIGRVCNLNPRQAFHALETKAILGRKVGGRWVAERGQLREFFLGDGS